jgi:17beta-estradiol 17-dehydrogenase / very-long-chain 3-oxoacyl-CoA reductase
MDKLQSLKLPDLQALTKNMRIPSQYLKPLAAVGSIWASYQLYRLANFTYYHFLKPYNLQKYKEGVIGSPWALVTGASDGIGLGFAEELASQGFNVILHGRNAQKLQTVSSTLQAQFPGRKFKILVLDAVQDAGDNEKIQTALAEFKDLDLKVLINNVGGMAGPKPTFRQFSEMDPSLINAWIDINLRFPTQFTRQLLPSLIENQPSLIVNISSGAANVPSPFIAVYSGSKAFNVSWSRSLAVELEDAGHDVDCHAIVVGPTATPRLQRSGVHTSLISPSPRQMARASLGYAGTGVRDVAAYWGHDYLMTLFGCLPGWYAEKFVRELSRKIIESELRDMEEEAKQQ